MEVYKIIFLLEKWDDQKYIKSLKDPLLKDFFDQISKHLLSEKSRFTTPLFREELFRALAVCYCRLRRNNIFSQAFYQPTLQATFKKLLDKTEWELNGLLDGINDLSLLTAYLEGVNGGKLNLWNSYPYCKKNTNHVFFRYVNDPHHPYSFEILDELLHLEEENLLHYFVTRENFDFVHVECLHTLIDPEGSGDSTDINNKIEELCSRYYLPNL